MFFTICRTKDNNITSGIFDNWDTVKSFTTNKTIIDVFKNEKLTEQDFTNHVRKLQNENKK